MIQLNGQQQHILDQIAQFMNSKASVFILRGYAGTGKTTMIKRIADILDKTHKVLLMAPTGRAARILSQKTGREATTIHRGIYTFEHVEITDTDDVAASEFKYHFPIAMDATPKVVIVDEASMICSRPMPQEMFVFGTDNLLEDLLTFVRPAYESKVIFVGDPAQLPPVGETVSNALNPSYFTAQGLEVMTGVLSEVVRQQGESAVLRNAMKIRGLLATEKRNQLVFDESQGEVEQLPDSTALLDAYMEHREKSGKNDAVLICYSNRDANGYNQQIRQRLYHEDHPELKVDDILIVVQNNTLLNLMNGEFVPILYVGSKTVHRAPVYVQRAGQKVKDEVILEFIDITTLDGDGRKCNCKLLANLLMSDKGALPVEEMKALYIDFRIRHPKLKPGTIEFQQTLQNDAYFMCLRAKYGYAVTGHKCQGGEWGHVFVDYTGRTGLSDDCLRWAYTATTRASQTLHFANFPRITPFYHFRIDPITRCKRIDRECRVFGDLKTPPCFADSMPSYLKAKYWCIQHNLDSTPFVIRRVEHKPYKEIYYAWTPDDAEEAFALNYDGMGVFRPAIPLGHSKYTEAIRDILDDEAEMPIIQQYIPSDETHKQLYALIKSVCEGLKITITNVVEHEDYSVNFYFYTSRTLSYLKVYVSKKGFVTYAKPQSLMGSDDEALLSVCEELTKRMEK